MGPARRLTSTGPGAASTPPRVALKRKTRTYLPASRIRLYSARFGFFFIFGFFLRPRIIPPSSLPLLSFSTSFCSYFPSILPFFFSSLPPRFRIYFSPFFPLSYPPFFSPSFPPSFLLSLSFSFPPSFLHFFFPSIPPSFFLRRLCLRVA